MNLLLKKDVLVRQMLRRPKTLQAILQIYRWCHLCSAHDLYMQYNSAHDSNPVAPACFSQDEPSSCLSAMIEAIASSGSPVKSQQLGEPDLTLEEKKGVLMDQYKSKPLVFLERYQAHLKPEHMDAFSHLSSDCRAQYYCKEIQRRASGTADRTRIRNHRYAALRALQKGKHRLFEVCSWRLHRDTYCR